MRASMLATMRGMIYNPHSVATFQVYRQTRGEPRCQNFYSYIMRDDGPNLSAAFPKPLKATSRIVLGTAQLGMKYGVANVAGMPDQAESTALIKLAHDTGVTDFDTRGCLRLGRIETW